MNKHLKRILLIALIITGMLLGYMYGLTDSKNIGGKSSVIGSEEVKKINRLNSLIEKNFLDDYDTKTLKDGMYHGYIAGLKDVYSAYFSEEEFKELKEHTQGAFGGVGIQVSPENGEYIVVIAPIKGTPAYRAGIKTDDKIYAIDGEKFKASELEEAVKVMRGEPGTKVKLTILRGESGKEEKIDFEITREIINVESVIPQLIEGDIGYVIITGFQERTAEDFKKAVEDLEKQGAKKLILDLRGNPGGLLDVTLEIADYLMDKGNIMKVRYKSKPEDIYKSDENYNPIPMVTLINKGSASASEVLSGALKDSKRSEIIGTTSFGKGVIQQIFDLSDSEEKAGVKLTIGEFYTPKGNKIHGLGIKPDIEVVLDENVKGIGYEHLSEDKQLQKAIEVVKNK